MSSVDLSTFLVVFAGVAVLILIAVGAYALTAKQRRRKQALRDVVAAGLLVRGDAPSETQSKEEQPGSPRRGEPPAGEQGVDVLDRPEAASSRLVRLRGRLVGSHTNLGRGMLMLLGREHIDQSTWEQVEDLLLQADVGVQPTQELVQRLRSDVQVLGSRRPEQVRQLLHDHLLALVGPNMQRSLAVGGNNDQNGLSTLSADLPEKPSADQSEKVSVVLVVGVNGTGKTTTVAKLARMLVAQDKKVILAAGDTFRAAAADQLQTWGQRVGVPTVRGPEGGDPASVAYEAVARAHAQGADVVLIDTAGRLHTKVGLMDELGKVKRVVEKHGPVDEVLLVLDATTGQNGLIQAKVFAEVVDITGIVLTKLDGSAKGGIVITVQRELGVPVKLVGLGEGMDDLAPFDPADFVDALLGPSNEDEDLARR